jgi:hypothetical protein
LDPEKFTAGDLKRWLFADKEAEMTDSQRDASRLFPKLMHDTYRTLDGPVVDPTRVKRALDAAAEKGAVWEGAVYAILNRVIARDPTAWVADDSHSYRGREDGSGKASTA